MRFEAQRKSFQERTAIVRLVFKPNVKDEADQQMYEAKIGEIAGYFRKITENREEELWLVRVPAQRSLI